MAVLLIKQLKTHFRGIELNFLFRKYPVEVIMTKCVQDVYCEIFKKHHKYMVAFAYNLIKNQEEAKDIVSESFVKTFQRFYHLEDCSHFYYLKATVRNACYNYLKSRARKQTLLIQYADQLPILESLVKIETMDQMRYVLMHLPDRERSVLYLYYEERLEYEDIASILEIEEVTVRKSKSRALDKLRKLKKLFNDTRDQPGTVQMNPKITIREFNQWLSVLTDKIRKNCLMLLF